MSTDEPAEALSVKEWERRDWFADARHFAIITHLSHTAFCTFSQTMTDRHGVVRLAAHRFIAPDPAVPYLVSQRFGEVETRAHGVMSYCMKSVVLLGEVAPEHAVHVYYDVPGRAGPPALSVELSTFRENPAALVGIEEFLRRQFVDLAPPAPRFAQVYDFSYSEQGPLVPGVSSGLTASDSRDGLTVIPPPKGATWLPVSGQEA